MRISTAIDRIFRREFNPKEFATALGRNNVHKVEKILRRHPEAANWISPEGRSALTIAVGEGMEKMAKLLIAAGADIEYMDPVRKMPPLGLACWRHADGIAEELVARGADVNRRDGHD